MIGQLLNNAMTHAELAESWFLLAHVIPQLVVAGQFKLFLNLLKKNILVAYLRVQKHVRLHPAHIPEHRVVADILPALIKIKFYADHCQVIQKPIQSKIVQL